MSSVNINSYPLDVKDRIVIVLEYGRIARSSKIQGCIERLGGLAVTQNVYMVSASQYSPEGVAEALIPGIEDGETIVLLFEQRGKLSSRLLVNGIEQRQEGIVPI
ncbi:hypothetical protein [Candidatus Entotheonella palauensis]|uniref:Uncharacterized protein n=1 Tax=Candidatus Entotheonella gemina TaxID=1429439 RepID=W4M7E4_9BACT|nr:hypothetical protein [Candidatus Entotheonella palauensis]ETX05567.1 MAG: hypothetical protein ETSY2_22220 [Candidatus Entotheonella gemina]